MRPRNLVEVIRHGYGYGYGGYGTTTAMDSLTYSYPPGSGNKLDRVADAVTGEPYPGDLADQSPGLYQFDQVGLLVDDSGTTMAWDRHGHLEQIVFSGAGGGTSDYAYDAAGNRVKQEAVQTRAIYLRVIP